MSSNPFGGYLTSALISQTPQLLVCIAAIVAGAVFLSRAKLPAILAMAGGTIFALSVIGAAVVMGVLIDGRQSGVNTEPWMMSAIGFAGSIGRAIGLGCLVGGIFVARPASEPMPMMGPPGQPPFQNYGPPMPPQKPPV